MKHLARSLMILGAMTAAGSANADLWGDFCPVLGADYYQVWMKAKNDWASVFPKSYPGGTVYVGTKFHDCFGVELGYDWSSQKTKGFALGSTFLGTAVPTGGLTGQVKVRRTGGHLDLVGYLPVCECLDLTGSIGFGWVQPKISITLNQNAGNSTMGSALVSVSGKSRGVFRVGVGVNYMVTDMVGLRAKLGWESTSGLRINGNQAFSNFGFTQKAFKGSATLSLGGFVKF